MGQRIVIDPVTRIEGHAKITIQLGDDGQVADARFHVAEFRGFERFCVGRPLWEMAGITARVCGICPVSHLIASAKAGDQIMSVTPPLAAVKLRRLMNLAQIVQSHSLSFFHLSSPDLILGFDSDPTKRNIFGLIGADREWARGRHPVAAVRPGGHRAARGQEDPPRLVGPWRSPGATDRGRPHALRDRIPEAQATVLDALGRFKGLLDQYRGRGRRPSETSRRCSWVWSATMAPGSTTTARSAWATQKAESSLTASMRSGYMDFIGEATQHDSYLKFPYYKPLGYPEGIYRVGPLARLNLCEPHADRRWPIASFGSIATDSALQHRHSSTTTPA